MGSKKYSGYNNANVKIKKNNPIFDLFDANMNVVDITTTAAKTLTPSSFHNKLKRLGNLDASHGTRTLQIYTKKGQYTASQITDLKNKLDKYITDNNLKDVKVSIDEVD